ncbi:MAG TPA: FAD-dependent oxidoreductase [Candidatus Dormibacteraeota bacterium]|nr:FAD-dependent oxidoreductase [Candidatus Dormibacteraeota bacterium]
MSRGAGDADVVVVGAGPAGAATALFAARRGHRVIVFDKQTFPRDKPCGEGLMPGGRPALRELGLEDAVVASGAPPLEGIQFGLAEHPPMAVPFPENNSEHAGLGIRRLTFDALLVDLLGHDSRIQFCPHTEARDVRTGTDAMVTVTTAVGEVRARFVAVADGLRSAFRHHLGWTVGPRPPHRYGIVAHWMMDAPVDPWVRITFDHGLEVYEGPVAGNQRMVGLLCYQDRMREFGGRLEARYREIALGLRPELRNADLVGAVAAVGPFWYRASEVAQGGVFLIGDAAGFSDPITGEGVAAGLRQARAFAAALESPNPEDAYRQAHRRLTKDPRRVAALFLRLSRTPALVERAVRGHQRSPQTLMTLLGIGFGYWGFNRVTPREWIRMFSGR